MKDGGLSLRPAILPSFSSFLRLSSSSSEPDSSSLWLVTCCTSYGFGGAVVEAGEAPSGGSLPLVSSLPACQSKLAAELAKDQPDM